MKLGFKKVNISPKLPVRLAGFGNLRWAKEIHDDLYARVFLFKGDQDYLWVQLDVCAIDDCLIDEIVQRTNLKKDNIILSATHTHSGPVGTISNLSGVAKGVESIFGDYNAEYINRVADLIKEAIDELNYEAEPFVYRLLEGEVNGLGSDRHDESLPFDNKAYILDFKLASGKEALITRMSCHPTVLNGTNLKVTADFCGGIERKLDNYDMVAYVNGSCGDMSTRFTRKEVSFNELERFADLVSKQLKDILNVDVKYTDEFKMSIEKKYFEVLAKEADSIEVAKEKVNVAQANVQKAIEEGKDPKTIRVLESFVEGANNNLLTATSLNGVHSFNLAVSHIEINGKHIITVPVELFSKLSMPYKDYIFVGYTNGYYLYMPDSNAYDKGYYESLSSPFKQGQGEEFIKNIIDWINN